MINRYDIHAKTKVLITKCMGYIERDPCYWKDAEEFHLERFLDSSIDLRGTHFDGVFDSHNEIEVD